MKLNFKTYPPCTLSLICFSSILFPLIVSIIACEDRLIRILNQSICEYEIETCGIPNTMCPLAKCGSKSENLFLYGTLEGKVSLVSLDFDRNLMAAIHKWEIPEKGSRAQVTCLTIQESTGELYIGRSNGAIELWIFSETLDADGNQSVSECFGMRRILALKMFTSSSTIQLYFILILSDGHLFKSNISNRIQLR